MSAEDRAGPNPICTYDFSQKLHICLIYNGERDRRAAMQQFLAAGARLGDKLSYFGYASGKWDVLALLEESGTDARALDAAGRLDYLPTAAAYHPDGTFTKEGMWQRLRGLAQQAYHDGFGDWRVTGEMEWALQQVPGSEQLVAYEAGLNGLFDRPCAVVCQYHAARFHGALLFDVLRVHPYLIARGSIVSNPYYEAA